MFASSRQSKIFAAVAALFFTLLIICGFYLLPKQPQNIEVKKSESAPALSLPHDPKRELEMAYDLQSYGISAGCFPRAQTEKILGSFGNSGKNLFRQLDQMSAPGGDHLYAEDYFCIQRIDQTDKSFGFVVAFLMSGEDAMGNTHLAIWHNLNGFAHKDALQIMMTPEKTWDREELAEDGIFPSIQANTLRIHKTWDAKKKNWSIQVLFQEVAAQMVSDIRTFSFDLGTGSLKQVGACVDSSGMPEELRNKVPCKTVDEF